MSWNGNHKNRPRNVRVCVYQSIFQNGYTGDLFSASGSDNVILRKHISTSLESPQRKRQIVISFPVLSTHETQIDFGITEWTLSGENEIQNKKRNIINVRQSFCLFSTAW